MKKISLIFWIFIGVASTFGVKASEGKKPNLDSILSITPSQKKLSNKLFQLPSDIKNPSSVALSFVQKANEECDGEFKKKYLKCTCRKEEVNMVATVLNDFRKLTTQIKEPELSQLYGSAKKTFKKRNSSNFNFQCLMDAVANEKMNILHCLILRSLDAVKVFSEYGAGIDSGKIKKDGKIIDDDDCFNNVLFSNSVFLCSESKRLKIPSFYQQNEGWYIGTHSKLYIEECCYRLVNYFKRTTVVNLNNYLQLAQLLNQVATSFEHKKTYKTAIDILELGLTRIKEKKIENDYFDISYGKHFFESDLQKAIVNTHISHGNPKIASEAYHEFNLQDNDLIIILGTYLMKEKQQTISTKNNNQN